MDTALEMKLETVDIPCILNRASLGDANFIFAVINDVFGQNRKVAWVPRKDVTINSQPLEGTELNATLKVKLVEERNNKYIILLNNDGIEETIEITK